MVPEVSEERVLDALETGIKHSRSISSGTIKISEVTAASKYQVVAGKRITPESARKMDGIQNVTLQSAKLNDCGYRSDRVNVIFYKCWYFVCFLFVLQKLSQSCADKMITVKPDLSACAASEIAHFMLFRSSNDISWGPGLA